MHYNCMTGNVNSFAKQCNIRPNDLDLAALTSFQNNPWFLRVCGTSLSKTLWEKQKLLVTSNFSFSHSVFYPFGEHSAIFIKHEIVVCKLFGLEEFKSCRLGKN